MTSLYHITSFLLDALHFNPTGARTVNLEFPAPKFAIVALFLSQRINIVKISV